MAEGLERGRVGEPEKQHEYFRFIVQECQRLSALIQNVLDVSRIDFGHKRYDFELANVSKLVSETVNSMRPAANERQIQLRIAVADDGINAEEKSGCRARPSGTHSSPCETRDRAGRPKVSQ